MAGEPSFFEIGVADGKKAQAFFGELFGWTIHPMGGDSGWLETGGVRGGLHDNDPENRIEMYFGVPDIEAAVVRVRDLGGHAEEPCADIPDFGRFAACRDDQGTRFGLHQAPA